MYSLEPANFSDYREFLKFRFDQMKERSKSFSLQVCANRSGLSKSHIQFLLNKQRHIALDKFPALAKTLKMNSEEEYFVYLMICKNSSQNKTVQDHFESIMKRIRNINVAVNKTTEEDPKGDIYQDCISMVLRSMIRLTSFVEDPLWIENKLRIEGLSKDDIRSRLNELENSGQIKRGEGQSLSSTDYNVFRPDPYDPQGFNVYTEAAEFVAKLMQKPHDYSPSVFSSMSLAMDKENLIKTEKLMIETHHKICEFAKQSKSPTELAFIGNFFMNLVKNNND